MDLPAVINMNRYLRIAGVLCAVVLSSSCKKDGVQDITVPAPASRVKFFNFGPGAPNVNFYANDTKMTAISSATGAESTLGVAQGGVGSGGNYAGIAPGTYTLAGKISAATDKDLAISSVSAPIADGKWYSYYISGPYDATAKKAEAFVVEDPVPAINYTVAYVRFVNAISNSGSLALSVKHQTTLAVTPIGAAVPYKSASTFIAIPSGVYDISARAADASTDLVLRTGVSFNAGNVYTIGARGDATLPSTGASANRPILDNTANR
jgi:hypothetical protein